MASLRSHYILLENSSNKLILGRDTVSVRPLAEAKGLLTIARRHNISGIVQGEVKGLLTIARRHNISGITQKLGDLALDTG